MALTEQQRMVVERRGVSTFVSAGAGTGKTSLLVECYLRGVLDDGIEMDRLPTVTFTRKAAGEMRSRVRDRLLKAGRPELARRLDSAPIGTIDSFAGSLLRRHPVEAGVDPGYAVLDQEQAQILQADVLEAVWEQALWEAPEADLAVLALFGREVRRELLSAYNALRGAGAKAPRFRLPPASPVAPLIERAESACRSLLDLGLDPSGCSKTMQRNLALAGDLLRWLPDLRGDEGDLSRLGEYSFNANCPAAAKPSIVELKEALQELQSGLAAGLLVPLGEVVDHLLVAFHEAYRARKAALGVLDFADLALEARDLLAAGVGRLPPGSRLIVDEFQDTNLLQCALFDGLGADAVLTVGDQFQSIYGFRGADVRVFQERAAAAAAESSGGSTRSEAAALSRNFRSRAALLDVVNHVFALPEFFGPEYRRLEAGRAPASEPAGDGAPAGDGVPAGDGEPAVGREPASGGEGEFPAKRGGGSAQASLEPAVELLALERDDCAEGEEWQTREAAAVADRIQTLLEDEGWALRDVVILLPALTRVDRYADALVDRGISAYVVGGRGYYAREEVTDVVSLLRVLVNPHDDLALAAVLRSPLGAVTDDTLIRLRAASRAGEGRFLWEGLEALLRAEPGESEADGASGAGRGEPVAASAPEPLATDLPAGDLERLRLLASRIGDLRSRIGLPGLSGLLDDAITAFDYDLVVLRSPDGRRRFANLRKLMNLADEYESVAGPDLAGFVRFLRQKRDLGAKEGSAATLAEEADVVRLMTIHQAKGLEFPVVVVAGLGSGGRPGGRPALLVGRNGSAALSVKRIGHASAREPFTLGPAAAVEEELREREEGEALRLAYVAMTRAKERLMLAGTRGIKSSRSTLDLLWAALRLPEELSEPVRPHPELDLVVTPVDASLEVRPSGSGGDASASRGAAAPRGEPGEVLAPRPTFPSGFSPGPSVSQVSFSALSLYASCPRRFYLERILGLRPPESGTDQSEGASRPAADEAMPSGRAARWVTTDDEADAPGAGAERLAAFDEPDAGRIARAVGVAVHRVLEVAPLTPLPEGLELQALVSAALAEQGLAEDELVARCYDLASAFRRSPLAGLPGLADAEREVSFLMSFRGLTVTGVFDILLRQEPHWLIGDYKTNRLDGRTPDEAVEDYQLQADLYAWAALEYGAPGVTVSFLFLEAPDSPVEFAYGRADRGPLEARLAEAVEGLLDGHFPPDERGCAHCSADPICAALGRAVRGREAPGPTP